jgi:hypothetical protein
MFTLLLPQPITMMRVIANIAPVMVLMYLVTFTAYPPVDQYDRLFNQQELFINKTERLIFIYKIINKLFS